MCKTFLKSHCLNIQDFVAAALSFFFDSRHEWSGIKFTCKNCLCIFQCKRCFVVTDVLSFRCQIRCKLTGRHSSSFIVQAVNIKICINHTIGKSFTLCQNRAVFCDQIMSAINDVLCGFTFSCCCINIAAEKSCRLCAHQTLTVRILAYNFITCRQIDDQIRTVKCMCNARRIRYPEIFTDFCCNLQFRHVFACKDCIRRNPDILLIKLIIHLVIIKKVFIIEVLAAEIFIINFFEFFKLIKRCHLNIKFHVIKIAVIPFFVRFAVNVNRAVYMLSGSKISCLIKFIIVWQPGLRYKSKDFTVIKSCCHIIKLTIVF